MRRWCDGELPIVRESLWQWQPWAPGPLRSGPMTERRRRHRQTAGGCLSSLPTIARRPSPPEDTLDYVLQGPQDSQIHHRTRKLRSLLCELSLLLLLSRTLLADRRHCRLLLVTRPSIREDERIRALIVLHSATTTKGDCEEHHSERGRLGARLGGSEVRIRNA
jgi:hypothetical protein